MAAEVFEQDIANDNVNLLNENLRDLDYLLPENDYNLPTMNMGMN